MLTNGRGDALKATKTFYVELKGIKTLQEDLKAIIKGKNAYKQPWEGAGSHKNATREAESL